LRRKSFSSFLPRPYREKEENDFEIKPNLPIPMNRDTGQTLKKGRKLKEPLPASSKRGGV